VNEDTEGHRPAPSRVDLGHSRQRTTERTRGEPPAAAARRRRATGRSDTCQGQGYGSLPSSPRFRSASMPGIDVATLRRGARTVKQRGYQGALPNERGPLIRAPGERRKAAVHRRVLFPRVVTAATGSEGTVDRTAHFRHRHRADRWINSRAVNARLPALIAGTSWKSPMRSIPSARAPR